jgi:hypothetical protein
MDIHFFHSLDDKTNQRVEIMDTANRTSSDIETTDFPVGGIANLEAVYDAVTKHTLVTAYTDEQHWYLTATLEELVTAVKSISVLTMIDTKGWPEPNLDHQGGVQEEQVKRIEELVERREAEALSQALWQLAQLGFEFIKPWIADQIQIDGDDIQVKEILYELMNEGRRYVRNVE